MLPVLMVKNTEPVKIMRLDAFSRWVEMPPKERISTERLVVELLDNG